MYKSYIQERYINKRIWYILPHGVKLGLVNIMDLWIKGRVMYSWIGSSKNFKRL